MHVLRFLRPAALLLLAAGLGLSPRLAPAQSVIPEIPEKESPFFVLNDENQDGDARRIKKDGELSPQNQYPLNKSSDRSASKMFVHFFTDMFANVHIGKQHSDSKLTVEPSTFSLDERRELTVTFTVMNRTSGLLKLDFPTSQRLEILVRDGNGKVIEKWSDDRAFDDVSGVVMINPGERIQYEEKIATRDMQPAQTYIVEASLANNPEFTRTATVKPSGKPRSVPADASGNAAKPSPSPTATPGA